MTSTRDARAASPKCGAKTRAGGTCLQGKGWGTKTPGIGRCKLHGGRSPNGQKAAQRELVEQTIAKLGVPRGTGDPFQLLEAAVQHAHGHLEAAAQVVRDAATPAADPTAKVASTLTLEVALGVYEQAIRDASRTGKAAVDADVANRLAALDERASGLLMRFVGELFDRVVPKTRRPEIEAWASTRLNELAAEYSTGAPVH